MEFNTEKTCTDCKRGTKNAFYDGEEIIAICTDCQDKLVAREMRKGKKDE